jgi:hypothetical protein
MKRKAKAKRKKAGTENSANNSASHVRGNPEKTRPFRFQKGQSGNPGGRPKDLLITVLRSQIDEKAAIRLSRAIIAKASRGSVKHYREIADRLVGRPTQQLSLSAEVEVANMKNAREKLLEGLCGPLTPEEKARLCGRSLDPAVDDR